jgi:hypothetical protein
MTRHAPAIATLLASLVAASKASALPPPVPHGALSGAHITYNNNNNINLTPGSGWVDGNAFSTRGGNYPIVAGVGTVQYCYIFNAVGNNDGTFAPVTFSLQCFQVAAHAPLPDGHDKSGGHTLFVGSFVTDDVNGNVVPFYRNGEQVILTPTFLNNNSGYAGTFDYGQGVPKNPLPQTISKNDPEPDAWTVGQLPLSASQVILDATTGTLDTADRYFCFLDPHNHAIAANGSRDCQAELALDRGTFNNAPSLSNLRVEINASPTSTVYYGADTAILQGNNSIYVYLAYRGYVEPLSRLVPR